MPKLPTERDYLAGVRHYCCVCRVFIRYSIQELDTVKNGILKLKKFYFDILDDLQEIKKFSPSLISGTTRSDLSSEIDTRERKVDHYLETL